jgi:hypothetical protein
LFWSIGVWSSSSCRLEGRGDCCCFAMLLCWYSYSCSYFLCYLLTTKYRMPLRSVCLCRVPNNSDRLSYITVGNGSASNRGASFPHRLQDNRLHLRSRTASAAGQLHASSSILLFRNISTAQSETHPPADLLPLSIRPNAAIRTSNLSSGTAGSTEAGLTCVPGCHALEAMHTPPTKGSVSQTSAQRIAETSNINSGRR